MAFQHVRFTRDVPSGTPPWALTPRFQFYPPAGAGHVPHKTELRKLFSVALSRPAEAGVPPLAGYVALCCPDFPSSAEADLDSAACSLVKVNLKEGNPVNDHPELITVKLIGVSYLTHNLP
jgi:hypothetical protein